MNGLIQSIVLGIARNLAMGGGAWLLQHGIVDASTANSVEGSLICLAGVAFTVFDKFVVNKKISVAAATGSTDPAAQASIARSA